MVRIVKGKRPDIIRVIERQNKFERREWWKQAARHWFNLSLPGHPWCNREFELWGLGLPVMAAQWVNPMLMNPLPNVHYIAVPGGHRDHTGTSLDPEFFADRIIETYFTFVKDYRTIERIAANGFEFYQKYLTMKNAAKLYIESIPWKEFE